MGKSAVKTSLRHKLLAAFLLISLLPLGILLTINYNTFDSALRHSINNNLVTITESRAALLESNLQFMQNNVLLLAKSPIVINSLTQAQIDQTVLGRFIENFYDKNLFADVILFGSSGKSINYKSRNKNLLFQSQSIEVNNIKDQATTLLELVVSNFVEQEDRTFAFYMAAPVFQREKLVGSVVVKGSSKILSNVVKNYTGLGRSGETIIIAKVDDRVLSIAPTRLQRNEQRVYEISEEGMQNPNLMPLFQSTNGTRGFGSMNDYRGVPVLAAWRYLPTLHGGIIVKIDRSEVLKPVLEQQQRAIAGGIATFVIVTLFAINISNSITAALISLTKTAKQMTKDSLQKRVSITSNDEIGDLAHSFNIMSDRLTQSFVDLETKVAERTAELSQAYERIEILNTKLSKENQRLSLEVDVVRRLQEMILPKEEELRKIHNLDMSGYMSPAEEVGGDYYDVLVIDDKCLVTIGDVTGHGLESGVFMLMAQTALRTLHLAEESSHVRFLNLLNKTLYENGQRMNCDRSMTLIVLEYQRGVLSLSGQHEEVIVARQNGTIERIDTLDLGFPLGLEEDISSFIQQHSILLNSGDVVLLYTDGITEAVNEQREFYGIDRLCEVMQKNIHQSAREVRDTIVNDVLSFVKDQYIFDDMTLFVFKQL